MPFISFHFIVYFSFKVQACNASLDPHCPFILSNPDTEIFTFLWCPSTWQSNKIESKASPSSQFYLVEPKSQWRILKKFLKLKTLITSLPLKPTWIKQVPQTVWSSIHNLKRTMTIWLTNLKPLRQIYHQTIPSKDTRKLTVRKGLISALNVNAVFLGKSD